MTVCCTIFMNLENIEIRDFTAMQITANFNAFREFHRMTFLRLMHEIYNATFVAVKFEFVVSKLVVITLTLSVAFTADPVKSLHFAILV